MSKTNPDMSKELTELINAVGECRSKQQEDKLMKEEKTVLKELISKPITNMRTRRECLIRAIYLEMLGHDASFTYLFAVNLTQDKNILNKRIGYLACSLLLDEDSEFYILLVASLQKDLQSDNWLEVDMALGAIAHFSNSLIIQAVSEPVLKLMEHRVVQIRKKVAMVLFKFYQVDKNSVPDIDYKMKKLLCDTDPSVMAATLPYYKEVSRENPDLMKPIISPLVAILKQVIENKLTREFIYHKFQGPWIQNTILEILGYLGKDDQQNSGQIYEVLNQCFKNAENAKNNIGYATMYQCVKTICNIYPNDNLIQVAGDCVSRFLKSDSPNLRCTGIIGLGLIIQINPKYVMNFQSIIVECMEVNDETLKKYTFNLLYKMTNINNVEIVVEKMIKYLSDMKKTEKSEYNIEVLIKIMELMERFAPSKQWFIKISNDLFINFGEMIDDEIITKLVEILFEWEKESESLEEFKKLTIENYATIVENYSIIPSSLVKLISLITGEYANKLYENDEEKIKGIIEMMVYLLNKKYEDDLTKCLILSAIMKIHSGINYAEINSVNEAIEKYSRIKNSEIQQRCLEYKRIKQKQISQQFHNLKSINSELDYNLSFLNDYCKSNNANKEYNPDLSDFYTEKFSNPDKKINIGPYQDSSNILSMPGSNSKINKLYESNTSFTRSDMKNELSVKAEKKWGEDGYIKDNKKEEKKWGVENIKIEAIDSKEYNKKENNDFGYENKINKKPRKKYEEEDPNKKKLMKDLFGGIDDENDNNNSDIKKNKNKTKKEQKNNENIFNNIDFNTSINTNNTTNNINNNNANNKENILNLFDGLTQNNISNNIPTNNNNNYNQNNIPNNSNNIDFFNSMINNTNNLFTPYNINTDKFGELWESFPEEESYSINSNIQTPQRYHEIIKSRANFAPVDIINNEAISAAYYKNQITLVHASIEINEINFLVKCQNQSLNNEVANYIMNLYK